MSEAQIVSNDSGVLNTSSAELLSLGGYEEAPQAPQAPTQEVVPQQAPQVEHPQVQPPPQTVPEVTQQQPPLDAAGQEWWNSFQQYTGVTQEQFTQGIQQLQQLPQIQQFVAQQQRESQLGTLRQEWGSEFDAVMPVVAERFKALPPQLQVALDNLEGARLLYAQIKQERGGNQQPSTVPPVYDRSRTPQQSQQYVNPQEPQFTRSQILNMNEADYVKNQNAITYAYQNGLVR